MKARQIAANIYYDGSFPFKSFDNSFSIVLQLRKSTFKVRFIQMHLMKMPFQLRCPALCLSDSYVMKVIPNKLYANTGS